MGVDDRAVGLVTGEELGLFFEVALGVGGEERGVN